VPELKQIVVVNRETKAITHWTLQGMESNFPMAQLALGASVPSAAGCILARDHLFRKFSGREDKIAPEFQSSER
jgi:hypothetical protein